MKKLNLGCGSRPIKGYVNIDKFNLKGIDVVHDLNKFPYPFKDNTFDEIISEGCIEELDDFIKVMEELHRISKNKAKIRIHTPAFPSFRALVHPYTKKIMTYESFDFFENPQSYYTKAQFKILKKQWQFATRKSLNWVSLLININPKFYARFISNIFPSDFINFELEVIK